MTDKTFLRSLCAALVFLAAPMSAWAASVNVLHDESSDGELDGTFGSLTDLGDLAVGKNEVFGVMQLRNNPSSNPDGFQVALKAGQTLESFSIDSIAEALENILSPSADFVILDPGGSEIFRASHSIGTVETLPVADQGAGVYFFLVENFSGNVIDPNNSSQGVHFTYRIDLNVSGPTVVPLPASLPLLGVGLFGLGVLARRQRLAG